VDCLASGMDERKSAEILIDYETWDTTILLSIGKKTGV
jgi:hypothetical protein